MTFRAMTPECILDQESYGPLLAEMQKEYSFNIRTLWKDVEYKKLKKCCTLSHMLAVYYAKANNWPYVMIFEDDAWPMLEVSNMCRATLDYIDKLKAADKPVKFVKCGFNGRVDGPDAKLRLIPYENVTYGSHTYILFESFYDDYIKGILENFRPADLMVSAGMPGAYTLNKSIFIQFNSLQYTDTARNVTVKKMDDAVYIDNRHCYSDCPAGYADFKNV